MKPLYVFTFGGRFEKSLEDGVNYYGKNIVIYTHLIISESPGNQPIVSAPRNGLCTSQRTLHICNVVFVSNMSVSTKSFESMINLAQRFYNPNLECYYVDEYFDITCQLLSVIIRKNQFSVVPTNVPMPETITCDEDGVIYICIPFLAQLVNTNIQPTLNKVEYVDHFNIFEGLRAVIHEKPVDMENFCLKNLFENFNQEQTLRFVIILRIIIMCSHFRYHYTHKIPFTKIHKPFTLAEMAKTVSEEAVKKKGTKETDIGIQYVKFGIY